MYQASLLSTTNFYLGAHRYNRLRSSPPYHREQPRQRFARHAVERDLDWEPEVSKGRLVAPSRFPGGKPPPSSPPPPPPPPPKDLPWYEWPFASPKNIALTLVGGAAAVWLALHNLGPIKFAEKPDIPFNLVGFTDVQQDEFVYFKTRGGHWVAAAEDEQGRFYMVDEIGDLYYDSGDKDLGMYVMDTEGNLYNFFNDGGERKIVPVGNVTDLRKFKINEIAGVKLDRDVNVVAFEDGSQIPLPPGTGYIGKDGKFVPPGELVEGYTRSRDSLLDSFLNRDAADSPPERFEVDPDDPTPFDKQLYDQVLFDDPDIPGFQPALPDDFDLEELAQEVEEEEAASGR